MIQPWEAYNSIPNFPANKEEEDDSEDYHPQEQDDGGVIKQEAKDATAMGADDLPGSIR
jgi:hypothetical protein